LIQRQTHLLSAHEQNPGCWAGHAAHCHKIQNNHYAKIVLRCISETRSYRSAIAFVPIMCNDRSTRRLSYFYCIVNRPVIHDQDLIHISAGFQDDTSNRQTLSVAWNCSNCLHNTFFLKKEPVLRKEAFCFAKTRAVVPSIGSLMYNF